MSLEFGGAITAAHLVTHFKRFTANGFTRCVEIVDISL